ncbi:MAG: FKBP-type peptidyl-prolyl cis-trans isomerase [Gemmatimonadetes bacterium]|nr:FKBP-type peptidyl-prolyl cis-trans isomerase [Gemmatimonadota bacterium]
MCRRLFLLAIVPFVFAACGGGSDVVTNIPAAIALESQAFSSGLGVNLAASTKTADGLYYRDVTVGTGSVITANHTIDVYYTGNLPDGTLFDSRTSGVPFSFILGQGYVIKGWDEGIVGMRVGGVRQLIVPAALGYGTFGSGPIPPNANLVFTVTVLGTT